MFARFPNHRSIALCLACLLATAGAALAADAPAKTSTSKTEVTKAAPTPEQQMEMMTKMGMPGAPHEMMKKCEGTWKATGKSWMGPGEPTTSEGSSEFKMILGGRFLEQRYTSTYMGQPFEGYGLNGYDNFKKAYTMTWVDNTSTTMMSANGSYDEAKKTLTFKTTLLGMDGKPMNGRMTLVFPDDNTQIFTMYGTEKGKESKMMELTYTRE